MSLVQNWRRIHDDIAQGVHWDILIPRLHIRLHIELDLLWKSNMGIWEFQVICVLRKGKFNENYAKRGAEIPTGNHNRMVSRNDLNSLRVHESTINSCNSEWTHWDQHSLVLSRALPGKLSLRRNWANNNSWVSLRSYPQHLDTVSFFTQDTFLQFRYQDTLLWLPHSSHI